MYSLEDQARKAENNNKWREAARLWKLAGRMDDAETCTMIADANDRGSAFREQVLREAGEEPEKTFENRYLWDAWFAEMNRIYKIHFQ